MRIRAPGVSQLIRVFDGPERSPRVTTSNAKPTAKCSRCGASAADGATFTVHTAPRSGRTILCQKCAAEAPDSLRCSFCGKAQSEVAKLVAGPQSFICDGCVATCVDILADTNTRWAWLRRIKTLWRLIS